MTPILYYCDLTLGGDVFRWFVMVCVEFNDAIGPQEFCVNKNTVLFGSWNAVGVKKLYSGIELKQAKDFPRFKIILEYQLAIIFFLLHLADIS